MRDLLHASLAVVVGLLAGCGSLPRCPGPSVGAAASAGPAWPDLERRHVIRVNSDGFLVDLREGQRRKPLTQRREAEDYLDETILRALDASGKRRVMVFIHGGLNDSRAGMGHFRDDYAEILAGEYYPVFVVWPSGWAPTYAEHLLWVRQGVKAETGPERAYSLLTSPLTLTADMGRAVTRLPLVVANNATADLRTAIPVRRFDRGRAALSQFQRLVREGYPVAIGDDYCQDSDRTGRLLSYCATLPVKYVVSSFIDGLGQGAWDNMLRRTQAVYPERLDEARLGFLRVAMRLGPDQRQTAPPRVVAETAGLSARQQRRATRSAAAGLPVFLDRLRSRQQGPQPLAVTLVGHSMGTIILNRVLRDTPLEVSHIVYMGAACSIQDFRQAVPPYLARHSSTQFYNLSLHPVAEVGEWFPLFLDLAPRGSLLVWLDTFLAKPVSEADRTFGRWENLYLSDATGEPFIRRCFEDQGTDLRQRLHFRAFSVGLGEADEIRGPAWQWNARPEPKGTLERCNQPLSHGEFTAMPYWQPDFWWQP